ncbi:unnamed protein product, partial [Symbiodinium sp. CCMP2456]
NLVITAAGGDFGTARIIQELRSQFPDAELKKRDASRKHQQSYLGSIAEEEASDEDEGQGEMSFVAEEELTPEGMALWSEASGEAESALAALHQARRTLRDARQRQHNVKMNRQYFRSSRGPRDDSQMTCLACGKKGHRMSACPQGAAPNKPRDKESAPFVCFAGETEKAGTVEAALGTGIPTSVAMHQGKCVVDSGATKSIGSAAVNGEDTVYFVRYQWSEIMHGVADARDPEGCASKVTGCVISDSRNVYDKLSVEVVSIKGAEKRANLELLSLKESQQRTGFLVRWVHSE